VLEKIEPFRRCCVRIILSLWDLVIRYNHVTRQQTALCVVNRNLIVCVAFLVVPKQAG
jgi:hypothetical protein